MNFTNIKKSLKMEILLDKRPTSHIYINQQAA